MSDCGVGSKVIADSSFRFVVASTGNELVSYDRRWKRTSKSSPFNGGKFEIHEGIDHFAVWNGTTLSLRSARKPEHELAKAEFSNGAWTFEGDNHSWATVPEYLLSFDAENNNQILLRIADGALADPLADLDPMNSVVGLTGSRLVVLAGSGVINVYDPISHSISAQLQLASKFEFPELKLRAGGSELWVNDSEKLLKIDTYSWEVLDAAGSDEAMISSWSFSRDESVCLVVHQDDSKVLIIDSVSLEPVAVFAFGEFPNQAIIFDDGHILGFRDDRGVVVRPRSKALAG